MYYLGIDIGGMSIKGGIVDANGKILYKKSIPVRADEPANVMLAGVDMLINDLIIDARLSKKDIAGVGMGVPGTVDSKRGIVTYACNINWSKVKAAKMLEGVSGLKVRISNDANCAALGETVFGGGKGYKNSILVTLGTGIGTGIIIDGKLFEGTSGAGAEAGHMALNIKGPKCSCGRRGCFESLASAGALARQTKEAMQRYPGSIMNRTPLDKVDGRTSFEAAAAGDKAAQTVVKKYIKYLSEGIIDLINIFRPEVIIIGGGLSARGDALLVPVQKYTKKYSYGGKHNGFVPVVLAQLGNDAGIIGAAALVMDL